MQCVLYKQGLNVKYFVISVMVHLLQVWNTLSILFAAPVSLLL